MGNCVRRQNSSSRSQRKSSRNRQNQVNTPNGIVVPPVSWPTNEANIDISLVRRRIEARRQHSQQRQQHRNSNGEVANVESALHYMLNDISALELHFFLNLDNNLQDDSALDTAVLYALQIIRNSGQDNPTEVIDIDGTLEPVDKIANDLSASASSGASSQAAAATDPQPTTAENAHAFGIAFHILSRVAKEEAGFLRLILSLIRAVPLDDVLGATAIRMLTDAGCLPTKSFLKCLLAALPLGFKARRLVSSQQLRNTCVVLGCLAEKLAGKLATELFSDSVGSFLLYCLGIVFDKKSSKDLIPPSTWLTVTLAALVAIEKFSLTGHNKWKLNMVLNSDPGGNPLQRLEHWVYEEESIMRQVGFCAQYALDNIFVASPERPFTYLSMDVSNRGALLNVADCSEYLKLSPDGLEARSDAVYFESVRCTASTAISEKSSVWFYEAMPVTSGVMQIGWASRRSRFLNHEGCGIGDDEFSVAYDGCRQLLWFGAHSTRVGHSSSWIPGDVVGCLLDLDRGEVRFALNGAWLRPHRTLFETDPEVPCQPEAYFAAASFMSHQQCRFNFGRSPFRHPPPASITPKGFANFNEAGLDDPSFTERLVLPRSVRLAAALQRPVLGSGMEECSICADEPMDASLVLHPCQHTGFCKACAAQFEACPLCREPIQDVVHTS